MHALRTSYAFVLIALAIFPAVSQSQTLTLGSTPRQVFCAGDQFDIAYSASGYSSNKNSFVIQMSDAKGSFATFRSIGSVRTTNSGTITATIPTDVANGTQYRIRVMSSDPYVVSADNGQNITMGGIPNPRLDYGPDNQGYISMLGEPVTFEHRSSNAASVRWDFGPGANPPTSFEASPTVTFNLPGYQAITLTAISAGGCEVTKLVSLSDGNTDYDHTKELVYVGSCNPRIPANALVDSAESKFEERAGPFCVVPGGVHDEGRTMNAEFFVEPGGTLERPSYFNIVYLKAGATLNAPSRHIFAIYEAGASLDLSNRDIEARECSDLEFDYSVAPPYKIQQGSVAVDGKPNVQLYPNPVSESIYRSNTEDRLMEAKLYSLTGNCVASVVEPTGNHILSVRDLPAGLYNLQLRFADVITFQKILVQR